MRLNSSIIPLLSLFIPTSNAFIVAPSSKSNKVSLQVINPAAIDPSSFSQETFEIAAAATVVVLGGAGAVLSGQKGETSDSTLVSVPEPEPIDVSIPYDAAAHLAYGKYIFTTRKIILHESSLSMNIFTLTIWKIKSFLLDEWRTTNDKGEFDIDGFKAFKSLYHAKTVADVTSKKLSREIASLENGNAESA